MTESSNNRNYTAADIERYHAGKMPAAEMHALEKAAMEDPFLADALEGYAFAVSPQQDIDLIREKLFGQKEEEKVVPLIRKNYGWMKAAAIIIFIAGGAWLAFNLTGSKKTQIAVQNNSDKTIVPADTLQNNDVAGRFTPSKQDSTNTATGYDFSTTRKNKSIPNSSATSKNQGSVRFDTYYSTSTDLSGNADSGLRIATAERAAPAQEVVTFKVLAPDSLVASNNIVTYNNVNMNASTAATSKITLPGYNNNVLKPTTRKDSNESDLFAKENKSKSFTSTDSVTNLNIVLQPDNKDVTEVVVSAGKKQESAEKRSFELKVDTLEPKEGWTRFDDYIARNIQVPDELKSKQPYSGEVELSFDVNKNGEPINITVTKSLCEKCDQEAIRLLKEGPRWKNKKSKKGKVTIKF